MSNSDNNLELRNEWSGLWAHDPAVLHFNHGAFGGCPAAILRLQQQYRDEMERGLWDFIIRKVEGLQDAARLSLAEFVGAGPDELAFVPNATTALNTVLRSLVDGRFLHEGVEILTTNHTYNACWEALSYAAQVSGAKVVVAQIPLPVESVGQVEELVLRAVTPRTKLAVLDHLSSPTAMLIATPRLLGRLREAGVRTLIDGAHAPGSLPLNLRELGATYYVGNCHKWLSAPKTAAFLTVGVEHQEEIRPLVISARAGQKREGRTRFRLEFDWTGTNDRTPEICVPATLKLLGSLLPGGWPALLQRNHDLAVQARRLLCERLRLQPLCPESMMASMFVLELPPGPFRALQERLLDQHRIEVQPVPWPDNSRRLLRVSLHAYNTLGQVERLGEAVAACLEKERA